MTQVFFYIGVVPVPQVPDTLTICVLTELEARPEVQVAFNTLVEPPPGGLGLGGHVCPETQSQGNQRRPGVWRQESDKGKEANSNSVLSR